MIGMNKQSMDDDINSENQISSGNAVRMVASLVKSRAMPLRHINSFALRDSHIFPVNFKRGVLGWIGFTIARSKA
jgi:hypothetical protein